MRSLNELSENAAAVGQAGLELARAEATALAGELKLSGRALARIAGLLLVALFVFFWALAAFVIAAIEVGSLWLPRWGSALAVFALLLATALVVGWVAWRRLGRLEAPGSTVKRRMEDHLDWWQRRIADRER